MFYLFFCPIIQRPKSFDGVLPNRLRPARRLAQIYSNDAANFWLVVASRHSAEPSKSEAPLPSLFSYFLSLHLPPETMGKRSPPRIPPVRIASPVLPTPPTEDSKSVPFWSPVPLWYHLNLMPTLFLLVKILCQYSVKNPPKRPTPPNMSKTNATPTPPAPTP